MSVAIIEINDCSLCCGTDKGDIFMSPGYALLTAEGITTGNAALQNAYLEPQKSFNQYWRQLNLSPLSSPTSQARHNADLAYAQLLQLHQDSGSPDEIIFAAPGSFDREQLSIILGLAKASPFKTLGLIDSAVAAVSFSNEKQLIASSTQNNQLLHLDIQLHQLVLTRLTVDSHIVRTQVDIIADIGLKTFYDNWARYIANQFIQQYRYDPIHTAKGEQQLYNSLPRWLEKINGAQELAIALDSPQGRYRLNLNRNDLLASCSAKLDQLHQRLNNLLHEGDTLITSHRVNLLPGLGEKLGSYLQLPNNAAVFGCLENLESITGDGENIHFITKLPNQRGAASDTEHSTTLSTPSKAAVPEPEPEPDKDTQAISTTPTHILYQHKAEALGDKLYIHQHDEQLTFSQQQTSDTALVRENGELLLQSEQVDVATSAANQPLQTGDTIKIGPHSLQLIEVI